jgi:hypothetical protein
MLSGRKDWRYCSDRSVFAGPLYQNDLCRKLICPLSWVRAANVSQFIDTSLGSLLIAGSSSIKQVRMPSRTDDRIDACCGIASALLRLERTWRQYLQNAEIEDIGFAAVPQISSMITWANRRSRSQCYCSDDGRLQIENADIRSQLAQDSESRTTIPVACAVDSVRQSAG